ncbi:MAG: hypothetical protein HN757_16870 [Calditrichaeota bacterium]|jgi:hypothetical protein|nr:hypothetical protein [Calditrichota bacterium]
METFGIKYHVVDGYFAKQIYVTCIVEKTDSNVICRLRQDVNLMFQYTGKQKPGRGRNKVYEGNINMQHIDRRRIKCCFNVDDCCVFSDVVYSVSLKRYIRIVYIEEYDN